MLRVYPKRNVRWTTYERLRAADTVLQEQWLVSVAARGRGGSDGGWRLALRITSASCSRSGATEWCSSGRCGGCRRSRWTRSTGRCSQVRTEIITAEGVAELTLITFPAQAAAIAAPTSPTYTGWNLVLSPPIRGVPMVRSWKLGAVTS